MKKVGVWMDKEKARVVTLTPGHEDFMELPSEVEFFNPKGGSRSKTKWGPQEVVQDSKYTEREKQQMHRYFQRLTKILEDADELALFGPAGTNLQYKKVLDHEFPRVASKVQGVEVADSMTTNQVKALVREFFSS